MAGRRFTFGFFELDESQCVLTCSGERVLATPRALATLLHLLERPGRLVSRQELLDAVWPDLHVEDNNLNQQIAALRRVLGDGWIETVPRRGYRFVGEVRVAGEETAPAAAAPTVATPRTRLWPVAVALVLLAFTLGLVRNVQRSSALAVRSLAVLPFAPLGEPQESAGEAMGLGLADRLIRRLGAASGVAVRPAAAVRGFAPGTDPVAAGRQLGVDAVLEASFDWRGRRLEVAARLHDVRRAEVVWSSRFEVEATDLATLEDAMARATAARLSGRPAAAPAGAAERRIDSEAYVAYLRGRWHWSRRTAADFGAAQAQFEAALQREPDWAPAWAGLADALLSQGGRHAEARVAATRALALDDTLAEPYATLGFLAGFIDRDERAARVALGRAIALDPSYATAHQWLAFVDAAHRRCPAALAAIERARALDPLSLIVATDVAHLRYYCGDLAGAERDARAVLALDRHFAQAWNVLAQVLTEARRYDEAIRAYRTTAALLREPVELWTIEPRARAGERAAAERDYRRLATGAAARGYWAARQLAWLGHREEAFAALQHTAEDDGNLMLLAVDPGAAALRADPRVRELLVELGLPAV